MSTVSPKEHINGQFKINMERVDSLLALHKSLGLGRGNPGRDRTDILRAAVVFLHMALEDYLRALGKWKWTTSPSHDVIQKISLPGLKPDKKFDLGDLMDFRGRAVDDVLRESIEAHFDYESFNDVAKVKRHLDTLYIKETVLSDWSLLAQMMKRRNQIAHQGDVTKQSPGRGVHRFHRLAMSKVKSWRDAVEKLQQIIDPLV